MRRMAYHLLAVLILAMTASTIKAQILLVTSGTPVEEYAAAELQRYYYQLSGTSPCPTDNSRPDN